MKAVQTLAIMGFSD